MEYISSDKVKKLVEPLEKDRDTLKANLETFDILNKAFNGNSVRVSDYYKRAPVKEPTNRAQLEGEISYLEAMIADIEKMKDPNEPGLIDTKDDQK